MKVLSGTQRPPVQPLWRRRLVSSRACALDAGVSFSLRKTRQKITGPRWKPSIPGNPPGKYTTRFRLNALGRGSNGGGGGNGGRGKTFGGDGSDDEKPKGVAWGSLVVGVVLGGSLCMNGVLMGRLGKILDPKIPPPPAPEKAIFVASMDGTEAAKMVKGKPESVSLSDPVTGSIAAVLFICCAAMLFSKKKNKEEPEEEREDARTRIRGGLLPLPPVGGVELEANVTEGRPVTQVSGAVELPSQQQRELGQTHLNVNLNAPQPAPTVVPVPIVVPFPMPIPMGQSVASQYMPVHTGAAPSPSAIETRVVLEQPPSMPSTQDQKEEPVIKKRGGEDVDDLGRQERERQWRRILDQPTPNIRTEYEFRGVLGRGSSSMVRMVVRKGTKDEFACKSVSKQGLKSKKDEEDVKREIQVMRHLAGNEHIVQLHGVYEDQKSIHLVLDLCQGGELFDSIVAAGNYSEKDAADTIRVILQVIAHCHGLRVIHRDIKPENFLWADAKSTKLKAIDFGLSAFYKQTTVFRDLVGSKYTIAPEVLTRSYTYKADIWSCGVIMYWLLSGLPPFLGDTLHEVFDRIRSGEIDYSGEHWNHISDAAKDCLSKMLVYRPNKRWSAEELLRHEWVNGVAPDAPISTAVINRFQEFGGMNRLQQVTRKVISEHLPLESLEGLKNMFQALDVDRDGTITMDEIKQEMQSQKAAFRPEELESILKAADVDGNGEINIEEFLAATVNAVDLMKEENLLMAFEHFDQDGSGYISREELKVVLKEQFPGVFTENIDQLIAEIDKDNDGQIDYEEFKGMMLGE
ncbi:hypothetical protein BSKO_03041 [Bryopsis sp. KO-2023]|nr:hypothetical protein BSKO_03041 [Bryopsis sp. KO-2023]